MSARHAGFFTKEDAAARGMRYVEAKEGVIEDGNAIHFYWLCDPEDGVIVDVKFQIFGQSALIAAAEAAAELLVSKNYDQARRITVDLIERHLRDHPEVEAFPKEVAGHFDLVIGAIEDGVNQCLDLPLPTHYTSPLPKPMEGESPYPEWETLSSEKKIGIIEHILDEEIRPYVELDAGGIEVIEITPENELKIAYQGSCTSCYSSVGSTLSAIQNILQTKVHPSIIVSPNLDALQFP